MRETLHSPLLTLESAVPLAHAWLQALLTRLSMRGVFMKGPALSHHGIRHPRVSADVDLLVERHEAPRLLDALRAAGWLERSDSGLQRSAPSHSVTLWHPLWPCDLDVHVAYPGLLAGEQTSFDAIWDVTTTVAIAHRPCVVPGRTFSAVHLALHSLRGDARQARHIQELEVVTRVPFTRAEVDRIGELSSATGAGASLRDILPGWGVTGDESIPGGSAFARWRNEVMIANISSFVWLAQIRSARGFQRISLAWKAFWPSDRDLRLATSLKRPTSFSRTRARLGRLGRGARALPKALRALREIRASPASPHGLKN